MPEQKHSAKWHSCVDKLKAEGNVESPEAVCTEALGPESFEAWENADINNRVKEILARIESQERPKSLASSLKKSSESQITIQKIVQSEYGLGVAKRTCDNC